MDIPDPAVFAASIRVSFGEAQKGAILKSLISRSMSAVVLGCMEAGASLIGHVKCFGEVESGEHVRCSAVTHDGRTECRGAFSDGSKILVLVINVLLYGLEETEVASIVANSLHDEFAAAGARMVIELPGREQPTGTPAPEHAHPDHDHGHGG